MKVIESREDIEVLVHAFYDKIRRDDLLGSIFNNRIAEEHWPEHLQKLTDFWETNLLGVAKFKGSPTQKHIEVDLQMEHTIEQLHFGRWLQLWFETIDENFEGALADRAKLASRKMATGQFLAIWNHRPEHKK